MTPTDVVVYASALPILGIGLLLCALGLIALKDAWNYWYYE